MKKKLAIISTYGELCGIAAYTHRIESYLQADFDITIIPLNQYFLRGETKRLRRLGDRHIQEIAGQLGGFDWVNLQYEPGTLGVLPGQIYRRFKALAEAAPAFSVTFHTFLPSRSFPYVEILRHAGRLRWGGVASELSEYLKLRGMSGKVLALLRNLQERKPVSLIVHTRREARHLRHAEAMTNVYDHPLAFLTAADRIRARETARRDDFAVTARLPEDTEFIGVFGFISRYKGTLTAVEALKYLPANHHLLIFGGIHPNEIRQNRWQEIDPYLERLLATIDPAQLGANTGKVAGKSADAKAFADATSWSPDVANRVHFMGALDDPDFIKGLCLCKAALFPYLEVGQTSSGAISLAIELCPHVLAARNMAFLELAKYHPGRIDFHEIGNYHDLAERIMRPGVGAGGLGELTHTTETNRAVYRQAHGLDTEAPRLKAVAG